MKTNKKLMISIRAFENKGILLIIGDPEFIGKKWIDVLMKENIPFFIRIFVNKIYENE